MMEISLYQNEEFFYRLVFEALDYNNDGYISEIDLFLTMRDLKSEIFIEVLMEDLVKIIQYIIDKKKLKGTYDESNYKYERIMKRVKKLNSTHRSNLSSWKYAG